MCGKKTEEGTGDWMRERKRKKKKMLVPLLECRATQRTVASSFIRPSEKTELRPTDS